MLGDLGELVGQCVDNSIVLGGNRISVRLVEHRVQQRAYPRSRRLRRDGHQVGGVVGPTPLPDAPGKVAPIALTSPAWASEVTSLTPSQSAGGQRSQEGQPAGPVFGGGDVDAQDFAVALEPTAIRACTLATRPPSRTLSTRASAAMNVYPKRLDRGVEFLGHHADLGLGQAGDPEGFDEFVHPPRGHPQQVAGGHHRGQRRSARLRRSSSHSGKYEPCRRLGIARSNVPVLVPNSRRR